MDLRKELELDVSAALAQVQKLTQAVNEITGNQVSIKFDTGAAERRLDFLQRRIRELDGGKTEIKVEANTKALDEVIKKANAGATSEIDIDVNAAELDAALKAADAGVTSEVKLSVTGDDAQGLLAELDQGVTAEVKIDVDSGELSELDRLSQDLTAKVTAVLEGDGAVSAALSRFGEGATAEILATLTGDGAVRSAIAELGDSTVAEIQAVLVGDGLVESALSKFDAGVTSEIKMAITGDDVQGLLAEADAGVTSEVQIELDANALSADNIAAAFATPLSAAAVGLGALFSASFGEALTIDSALAGATARLNASDAEIAGLGEAAGNLYAGAWGASIEENLSVLEQLARFELVATADVSGLEEAGTAVIDFGVIWETETSQVTEALNQLDQFNLADGPLDGLNKLQTLLSESKAPADELLESIKEYSPFISDAGLDFEDFAGIIKSSGASTEIEVDKIGDSIKELTIKIDEIDGEAIERLGEASGESLEDIEQLVEALQNAEPGAFEEVVTILQGIKDPADQAKFSIELFGAAGEDAAALFREVDFSEPFTVADDAISKAGDAVNDNLGVKLTTLGRTIKTEVVDVMAAELLPEIEAFVDSIDSEDVANFTEDLIDFGRETIELGKSLGPIVELIGDLVGVVGDIAGPAASFIDFFKDTNSAIGDFVPGMERATDILNPLGTVFGEVRDKWNEVKEAFGGDALPNYEESLDSVISKAKDTGLEFGDLDEAAGTYNETTRGLIDANDELSTSFERFETSVQAQDRGTRELIENNQAVRDSFRELSETELDAAPFSEFLDEVIEEFEKDGKDIPEAFADDFIKGIQEKQPDISDALIENVAELPIEEIVELFQTRVPDLADAFGDELAATFGDQKDKIEESLIEATSLDGVIETFEDGLKGLQEALDAQELRYDVVDQLEKAGFDDVANFATEAGDTIIQELNDALAAGDLDKIQQLESQFDELRNIKIEVDAKVDFDVNSSAYDEFVGRVGGTGITTPDINPIVNAADYNNFIKTVSSTAVKVPDITLGVNSSAYDEFVGRVGGTGVTTPDINPIVNAADYNNFIQTVSSTAINTPDITTKVNSSAYDEFVGRVGGTGITPPDINPIVNAADYNNFIQTVSSTAINTPDITTSVNSTAYDEFVGRVGGTGFTPPDIEPIVNAADYNNFIQTVASSAITTPDIESPVNTSIYDDFIARVGGTGITTPDIESIVNPADYNNFVATVGSSAFATPDITSNVNTSAYDEFVNRVFTTGITTPDIESIVNPADYNNFVAQVNSTTLDQNVNVSYFDPGLNLPTLTQTVNVTRVVNEVTQFANGGLVDDGGQVHMMARGGIAPATPGGVPFVVNGMRGVMAENGGAELFINEKSSFGRQMNLINKFAGGKLNRDLEEHYFGRFASAVRNAGAEVSQRITSSAPASTSSAPAGPQTVYNQEFKVTTPVRDPRLAAREIARQVLLKEREAASRG